MSRELSASTTLEDLKKEAKRWLKSLRADDQLARARLSRAWPKAPADPGLRDIQHALALEHGFRSWASLKQALRPAPSAARPGLPHCEKLAEDLLEAYRTGNPSAMQRVWDATGHRRSWDA
jgi:hypothetical protein